MMLWVPFIALVGLIVLAVPVAFAMGLAALITLWANHALFLLPAISERMHAGTTSFLLLAIPFFILAGYLMNAAGMTTRLFTFANYVVGRFTGGLGHVNVLASMIFSGMSGSAVADASALGAIEIKAMTDAGYDRAFSAAITAASSTIGPVVPPSIPFVIYGGIAGVSVGALFLAGFLPGIIMGIALMVAVYMVARRRDFPTVVNRPTLRTLLRSFLDAIAALGTVVIIVGGIIGGLFTPTEAAVVASLYALVLGLFVYRTLRLQDLPGILWNTARSSIQVLFIIAAAAAFGFALTYLNIPDTLVNLVSQHQGSPVVILLAINALILVLGMFMEGISIMLIAVPVLLPTIHLLGIDPVHFGVVFTLDIMIGLITPPMGLSLYAVMTVSKTPMPALLKELTPYYIALLVALVIVTIWPAMVLAVPHWLMGYGG
jgi:tripartite ATP-independent transporter DctM subunit